jgi:hypothetical protein
VKRVSRVLLNAETVTYIPELFNAKNAPKQVRLCSDCLISSTFMLLILTYTN